MFLIDYIVFNYKFKFDRIYILKKKIKFIFDLLVVLIMYGLYKRLKFIKYLIF